MLKTRTRAMAVALVLALPAGTGIASAAPPGASAADGQAARKTQPRSTVVVRDRDRTSNLPVVAMSGATFTYGAKRVSAEVRFDKLPADVFYFDISVRGPGYQTDAGPSYALWEARWEAPQNGQPTTAPHRKARMVRYEHTPKTATEGAVEKRVRCKVRWREDLDAKVVRVSFPVSCLKRPGPGADGLPKWLRARSGAFDHWRGGSYMDDVPSRTSKGFGFSKTMVRARTR
jgi:hypothetical protein